MRIYVCSRMQQQQQRLVFQIQIRCPSCIGSNKVTGEHANIKHIRWLAAESKRLMPALTTPVLMTSADLSISHHYCVNRSLMMYAYSVAPDKPAHLYSLIRSCTGCWHINGILDFVFLSTEALDKMVKMCRLIWNSTVCIWHKDHFWMRGIVLRGKHQAYSDLIAYNYILFTSIIQGCSMKRGS